MKVFVPVFVSYDFLDENIFYKPRLSKRGQYAIKCIELLEFMHRG